MARELVTMPAAETGLLAVISPSPVTPIRPTTSGRTFCAADCGRLKEVFVACISWQLGASVAAAEDPRCCMCTIAVAEQMPNQHENMHPTELVFTLFLGTLAPEVVDCPVMPT